MQSENERKGRYTADCRNVSSLMLKYANLNTGFDDDLYQEFVCCVISCIFKFPFEKWNAENDLD